MHSGVTPKTDVPALGKRVGLRSIATNWQTINRRQKVIVLAFLDYSYGAVFINFGARAADPYTSSPRTQFTLLSVKWHYPHIYRQSERNNTENKTKFRSILANESHLTCKCNCGNG